MESAVLHARILCELFANPEGKFNGDVGLLRLLPDWDWNMPKYERLNELLSELENRYGQRLEANSPHWTFSKMLAYPTLARSSLQHNYAAALNVVLPLLRRILVELQSKQPWAWLCFEVSIGPRVRRRGAPRSTPDSQSLPRPTIESSAARCSCPPRTRLCSNQVDPFATD
jgi:hypothetical protein